MISEQDKQAILNGAYCTTRGGQKVKLLAQVQHGGYVFGLFKGDFICLNEDDSFCFFVNRNFEYLGMQTHKLDIIGLWQEKPEPFDLERALNGEPVLLRSGLKAFVVLDSITTAKKKFNKGSLESDEYPLLVFYFKDNNETLYTNWLTVDGLAWKDEHHDDDIIGMWKEPEPQLSTDSLQLPKPLTQLLSNGDVYFTLTAVEGKYVIDRWKWGDREADHVFLSEARIYKTKADVIKVIETITGKPYEDR